MKKKNVFLNAITLNEFRGFGINHKIELSKGPGVTLLSGSNGLGKSTVIESIEWALTGKILRLQTIGDGNFDQVALLRENASKKIRGLRSFSVKLDFKNDTDEIPILREVACSGGRVKNSFPPDMGVLKKVLVDEKWRVDGESLSTYLHLTHIQSQSGLIRFSGLSPKEQWERLRGPVGLNILSTAQEKIAGATRAFNEERSKREFELSVEKKSLAHLKDLFERKENLKLRLLSSNSLNPEEAFQEILKLQGKIGFDIISGSLESQNIHELLGEMRAKIDKKNILTREKLNNIQLVSEVPKILRQIKSKIEVAERQLGAIEDVRIDKKEEVSVKETEFLQNRDNRKKMEIVLENLRRTLAARLERSHLRSEISQIELEIAVLDDTFKTFPSQEEDLQIAIKTRESEIAARRDAVLDAKKLKDIIRDLEGLILKVSNFQKDNDLLDNKDSQEKELFRAIDSARTLIAESETELAKATTSLIEKKNYIERAGDRIGTLEKAITAIFGQMSHDDENCPICFTSHLPGELVLKAEQAALAASNLLAPLEKDYAISSELLEGIRARRVNAENALAGLMSAKNEIDSIRMKVRAQAEVLQSHPLLSNTDPSLYSQAINSKISEYHSLLTLALEKVLGLREEMEIQNELWELQKRKRALADDRLKCGEQIEACKVRINHNSMLLTKIHHSFPELLVAEELSESLEAKISDVDDNLTTLKKNEELLQTQVNDLNKLMVISLEQIRVLSEELDVLKKQMNEKMKDWLNAGFSELDDEIAFDKVVTENKGLQSLIGTLTERLNEIKKRLTAHEDHSDLEKIQLEINAIVTDSGVTEDDAILQKERAVVQKLGALESFGIAEAGIMWLKENLVSQTQKYSKEVLAPLNQIHNNFLNALSTGRNWDIKSHAKTSPTKTEMSIKVDLTGNNSVGDDSFDANQILSEGQMSAVALAQLLSMSYVYDWSKWRALLLDAPTQHNDLIHVAAFVEVLRNLVISGGYQVIISTHDLEEASYLRRKLQASGIEVVEHRFIAQTENGVSTKTII